MVNFEGLASIFELGIQQIWIQHTLIPLEHMYAIKLHNLPSALFQTTFSEIMPSLSYEANWIETFDKGHKEPKDNPPGRQIVRYTTT